MAYIFHEDELPSWSRLFRAGSDFLRQQRTDRDRRHAGGRDALQQGASSPYHLHENCEHFYFIMEGKGIVETPEGSREVVPATWCSFPPRPSTGCALPDTPLFYFEFQAPNRFKTTILDGTPDDLRWNRVDGRVWVQT